MPPCKRFVYVIRSERNGRAYAGVTWNVRQRLQTHNSGGSVYTRQHRPWRLVVVLAFPSEDEALSFERYLKSGSGRAFLQRHFK